MARAILQQQDAPVKTFAQDSFSGGINTSAPADRIQDNELVDSLNFEYDSEDQLISRSGVVKFHTTASYTGRITSIHYYENDAGNIHVLHTNANKLYRTANTGGSASDITGGLTFPSDTFWQWKNFAGYAIGVNKATSGDNPIVVSGAGPSVAAISASDINVPKAKYIEIWNNRVWLVGASQPNTLYASALGNPLDWTTTGANGIVTLDISKNDGDRITGIIAFRERLFVFKRTKIYVLSATAEPNTDPDNLRVDIFANNIGCVSAYSIKSVLDDVVFLSEGGLASLAASEAVGDFTTALLSRNVQDIARISKLTDEISGHVMEEADQYILGVPATAAYSGSREAFILDYKQIQNRVVRWFRFDGKLVGTTYATIYVNGARQILVGALDTGTTYRIYKYIPKSQAVNVDDASQYIKSITTKAYNFGTPLYRKLFHRFGFTVRGFQSTVNFTVQYFFDQLLNRTGIYGFNLTQTSQSAVWDVSLWDAGLWDVPAQLLFRIWRRFRNNSTGRKGVSVQFYAYNGNPQFLSLSNLQIEYSILNQRRVRNG